MWGLKKTLLRQCPCARPEILHVQSPPKKLAADVCVRGLVGGRRPLVTPADGAAVQTDFMDRLTERSDRGVSWKVPSSTGGYSLTFKTFNLCTSRNQRAQKKELQRILAKYT